jgi:hypothetical protein
MAKKSKKVEVVAEPESGLDLTPAEQEKHIEHLIKEDPVAKKNKDKELFLHESGQLGYIDENNNFIPT